MIIIHKDDTDDSWEHETNLYINLTKLRKMQSNWVMVSSHLILKKYLKADVASLFIKSTKLHNLGRCQSDYFHAPLPNTVKLIILVCRV